MAAKLHRRLEEARRRLEEKHYLERKLADSKDTERSLEEKIVELGDAAAKERDDVERLLGLSLSALLGRLVGDGEEKLSKERAEEMAARLKLEAAQVELADLRLRITKLRELLAGIGAAELAYEGVVEEKKQWLVEQGGVVGVELMDLAERQGHIQEKLRELVESIEAGYEAGNFLGLMLGYLGEAKEWSMLDMMHNNSPWGRWDRYDEFGKAHVHAVDARQAVARFESGLRDLEIDEFEVELPGTLFKFVDVFFDGLFGDLVINRKVQSSFASVRRTLNQVAEIRMQLEDVQQALSQELERARVRTAELVNSGARIPYR